MLSYAHTLLAMACVQSLVHAELGFLQSSRGYPGLGGGQALSGRGETAEILLI